MEKITINTGLHRFLLLDRITAVDQKNIQGYCLLSESQAYISVEAMAQLGAMHVRYRTDFSCHAFLLGIGNLHMPEKYNHPVKLNMTGILKSRSTSSFSYAVTSEFAGGDAINGDFLYATIPYDEQFQKERLKIHYEKVFSCLQNVS
jgi:hypothetical protein